MIPTFKSIADIEDTDIVPSVLPDVDKRAILTPRDVEEQLVDPHDDAAWARTEESAFRERAFHTLYERSFATVKDPTIRFGMALAASCRQFLRPHLVPKRPPKPPRVVKDQSGPTAESLGTPQSTNTSEM